MDIVIGGALIVLILFCIGFGWSDIAVLGVMVVGALIVLIGGFFAVCLVLLAASKRKTAVFVGFSEERRFPCAVYAIDGNEVPNMFPCEMVMKNKLYVPEKEIKVLYCRPCRMAIDNNALLTMILGGVVFIPAAVFATVKIAAVIGEIASFGG
ncbi:MAG: hypothetical protein NC299_08290 [Lachnospiraceae bacterium]|nr:hypothetical protein [Ruminococcus sp.]MCM1275352.1 hypothetical protein [Lachnospiraceae bacterium]